jgi:Rps23 Pro-64 3,4-dihydroxylase Tpa1-like proline 4-hydroxylase
MIYNSPETTVFNLTNAVVSNIPFPHFTAASVLPQDNIKNLYKWFLATTEWHLVETDFYEQYEFSLLKALLPDELKNLISEQSLSEIESLFKQNFNVKSLQLVDVVAHKLINSQHIGVHNDYIDEEETHRMVLHINPEWKDENGGFLMLFNSSNSQDFSKLVKPINNTVFGFEISRRSHHAVSQIHDFVRYTLVYTFKRIS